MKNRAFLLVLLIIVVMGCCILKIRFFNHRIPSELNGATFYYHKSWAGIQWKIYEGYFHNNKLSTRLFIEFEKNKNKSNFRYLGGFLLGVNGIWCMEPFESQEYVLISKYMIDCEDKKYAFISKDAKPEISIKFVKSNMIIYWVSYNEDVSVLYNSGKIVTKNPEGNVTSIRTIPIKNGEITTGFYFDNNIYYCSDKNILYVYNLKSNQHVYCLRLNFPVFKRPESGSFPLAAFAIPADIFFAFGKNSCTPV